MSGCPFLDAFFSVRIETNAVYYHDEVFVLVNGTNNLHGKFYMHKTGYAHYTLSGIDRKIETYTDKLVAEHFLENPHNYKKIWHIDRDKDNCHYRNLVWVSSEEYIEYNVI